MSEPFPDPILHRRVTSLERKIERLEALIRQFHREQLRPELRFPSIRDLQLLERRVKRLEPEDRNPDA